MATVVFTPNLQRHVEALHVLDNGLPAGFAYDLVFASVDRGDSWSVVSHHLPPVHAVRFAP